MGRVHKSTLGDWDGLCAASSHVKSRRRFPSIGGFSLSQRR